MNDDKTGFSEGFAPYDNPNLGTIDMPEIPYTEKVEHEDFTVSSDGVPEPEDGGAKGEEYKTYIDRPFKITFGNNIRQSRVEVDGRPVQVHEITAHVGGDVGADLDMATVTLEIGARRISHPIILEGIITKAYDREVDGV